MNRTTHQTDYERIAQAIHYIREHFHEQPDLATIAAQVGLSEHHFQRLFRRWAGISPKRFVQYLTADYARTLLNGNGSVLDAAYEAGLSGPGRLHDLTVSIHAATPGEIRSGGQGITIHYGCHETPFGMAFIALTERGICALRFYDNSLDDALTEIETDWPAATIIEAPEITRPVIGQIFSWRPGDNPLTVWLRGTNFQVRVWEALLSIPPGQATTYQQIAAALGQPSASRAVGSAVGRNPIAYLIPCHRVLRKSGELGGYRWGSIRKQAILAWEGMHMAEWATTGL